jgi:hypothetical protein
VLTKLLYIISLHARVLRKQSTTVALLDPAVTLPISTPDSEMSSELERCISIELLCIQEAPDDRSDMSTVVAMLNTRRNGNASLPRASNETAVVCMSETANVLTTE